MARSNAVDLPTCLGPKRKFREKNVLIVTAGVPGVDYERLLNSASFIVELATKYLGGSIGAEPILKIKINTPLTYKGQ
jgi:hypothetical protein